MPLALFSLHVRCALIKFLIHHKIIFKLDVWEDLFFNVLCLSHPKTMFYIYLPGDEPDWRCKRKSCSYDG